MPNHLLPTPTGIDYPIQLLQNYLYERLYNMWGESGLTSSLFEMYGRVYRNETQDGFVPQWYKGNQEYSLDMFYNDKVAVLMWFGVNDNIKVDNAKHTNSISLYVMCNVPKLYPDETTQRLDEQIKYDVESLISDGNRYGFKITDIVNDIDNVLSKFSGSKKKRTLKDNLQPKLCFRIDMTNMFNIDAYQLCTAPNAIPTNFYAMTGTIQARFKTSPDTSLTQTLVNGVRIQLEYPVGNSLIIPHLVGRYVQPDIMLDGNAFSTISGAVNEMQYDLLSGEFTYGSDYPNDGFQDGSIMTIMCNENN